METAEKFLNVSGLLEEEVDQEEVGKKEGGSGGEGRRGEEVSRGETSDRR